MSLHLRHLRKNFGLHSLDFCIKTEIFEFHQMNKEYHTLFSFNRLTIDLLNLHKAIMKPFLFQKSIPNQSVKLAEVQSEVQGHPTLLVELNRRVEGIAVNLICLLSSRTNIIIGIKATRMNCKSFLHLVIKVFQTTMSS